MKNNKRSYTVIAKVYIVKDVVAEDKQSAVDEFLDNENLDPADVHIISIEQ